MVTTSLIITCASLLCATPALAGEAASTRIGLVDTNYRMPAQKPSAAPSVRAPSADAMLHYTEEEQPKWGKFQIEEHVTGFVSPLGVWITCRVRFDQR